MDKLKKAFGIGALVLALAGCSKIDSGRIIDKRYEPEREYSKRVMITVKPLIMATRQFVDDEDFIITFGGYKDDKFKTRTVYVTKEVYDSLNMGDNFDTSKIPFEDSDYDRRKKR